MRNSTGGGAEHIGNDGVVQIQGTPQATQMDPRQFESTRFKVSLTQTIGDRRTQEDRYVIVPRLDSSFPQSDGAHRAFFGVFDGTVGDFASDTVKDIITRQLLVCPAWQEYRDGKTSLSPDQERSLILKAVREMYQRTDQELLSHCARAQQHYATCTSVTLLVLDNYLVVSHLGDSRIAVAKNGQGDFVTSDHKPDLESERRRIEECGGMVERLVNHNNKPFIRGGDFMMRKALGEQPMQLQYSRAFGAKDLKMFGLSAVPDVNFYSIDGVSLAILASDGLWDVFTAQQATDIALVAIQEGKCPSATLVHSALHQLQSKQARADNITVLVVKFV